MKIKFLLCVDDTDDLSKSTSTGTVADMMRDAVCLLGGRMVQGITRHQLLLHEDIAYTSHNSSMCFEAEADCADANETEALLLAAWEQSSQVIRAQMASVADPGLCLCRLDQLSDADTLISWGRRAQREVLTQAEAYRIAAAVGGVRLAALGGDGSGVIGALAGVGLRLWGNDGTLRGKGNAGGENITLTAAEMKKRLGAAKIITMNGDFLADDTPVLIEKNAKLAFLNHQIMAVARQREDGLYVICKKADLYNGDRRTGNWTPHCPDFAVDNDYEESYGDEESDQLQHTCYNCLYRRWNEHGFDCLARSASRRQ